MNVTTVCLLVAIGFSSLASAAAPDAAAPAMSDGLVAVKSKTLDEVYLRPGTDLSAYRQIIVETGQVAVANNWMKEINSQRDIRRWVRPDDAERITEVATKSLQPAVIQAFQSRGYEVATGSGEGVLRLTASATDIFVNAPDLPQLDQVSFVRDNAGKATLRLDVRDAMSGLLLARVVDRGTARELRLNNHATNGTNQFWFDALFREFAGNSATEFEKSKLP